MTTITGLPGQLNYTIYQAATFGLVMTWAAGSPAVPVDLTGYTADMKVKDGQTTVIELSTGNGRIVLGGAAGTITLTVTATDTAALAQANADYDLLLTSPGGQVTPLVSGLVQIRKSITGGE